jgi:hypothetical protein
MSHIICENIEKLFENDDYNHSSAMLKVKDRNFGLLYIDQNDYDYAIAWDGDTEFSQIECAALWSLPRILSQGDISLDPNRFVIGISYFVTKYRK